jgi:DNA replication and repair protein RecF
MRYQRALAERNQLFKGSAGRDEIEAWTEELALTGAKLARARHNYARAFLPEAVAAFGEIFGGVPLDLRYTPSPAILAARPESDWAVVLGEELRSREPDDRQRGFTTIGPHRDDVEITLGGREARVYASQGQTRALALAFRVAQIRHAATVLGAAPIFILDDVGSELDETRRGFLAAFLTATKVQAFVTATDRALLPTRGNEAQVWRLAAGKVALDPVP